LSKAELAKKRARIAAKISKLKALRMAREAELTEPEILVPPADGTEAAAAQTTSPFSGT
jgi:hypothetical protein